MASKLWCVHLQFSVGPVLWSFVLMRLATSWHQAANFSVIWLLHHNTIKAPIIWECPSQTRTNGPDTPFQTNTRHSTKIGLMLAYGPRRWPDINPTSYQHLMLSTLQPLCARPQITNDRKLDKTDTSDYSVLAEADAEQ